MIVADPAFNDDVALQFGRVGKNKFTMDLKYPLNPFQAFCICVACLDNKLADRKGYEFFKKIVTKDNEEAPEAEASSGSLRKEASFSCLLFTFNQIRNVTYACIYRHR